MYSKKILGYSVSEQMKTSDILPALEMALNNKKGPFMDLIHHSGTCRKLKNFYFQIIEKKSYGPVGYADKPIFLQSLQIEDVNIAVKNM